MQSQKTDREDTGPLNEELEASSPDHSQDSKDFAKPENHPNPRPEQPAIGPDAEDFTDDKVVVPDDGFSEKRSQSRAEILARGRAALKRRAKADRESWVDWQAIIPMLYLGHRDVLTELGLSLEQEVDVKSLGRRYTHEFSRWLLDNGMPPVPATTRAAAIRCAPILLEINQWRATVKPQRLSRLLGPQANSAGLPQIHC